MNGEELQKLMQEVAEEIGRLPDDPVKPLSKAERKRKVALQARSEALGRIKAAREKGSIHQEAKAYMDYALWTEYGERNLLLFNLMKARLGWGRGW